jgi:hypothetical protein
MADRSTLPSFGQDDVPQTPKLQLISPLSGRSKSRAPADLDAYDTYLDTVPPPTRPARLSSGTRVMLGGFLVVVGFLAGVAAQKHHDAGYYSPDQVARAMVGATAGQQSDTAPPPTSAVPHTEVPTHQ